ncbi:MAG TPA: serine hydrolase, partial [Polyangia bacterium]
MFRRSRLAFATTAVFAALTAAACDDPDTRPPHPTVGTELQKVLDASVARPGVFLPGAIAHTEHPAYRAWSGAAGVARIPAAVPLRPADKIRAGSVLKTFLAAVVLQHVEAGALSLEQTLP